MDTPETVTLEFCDEVLSTAPTQEDFARALDRPRNEDWYLTLTRGEDDYMDATLKEDGTFLVGCEENGKALRSASVVDEALLQSLFASFLARDGSWSRQCQWEEPPPPDPAMIGPTGIPPAAWFGIGLMIAIAVLAMLRKGEWIVVLFALAIPGVIAVAAFTKLRDARAAASWTKGSAHIVRSDLVTEERGSGSSKRTVRVPAIEYEFSIGFAKHRGKRVSIGEIMPDTPEVQAALARYPVGASATVYYDPHNPRKAVLERDLPKNFHVIWIFILGFAAVLVAGALWFIGAFK